jgi:hypothetical protein
LIQKNRRRGKNSVQRRTKSFALSIKKFKKNSKRIFFTTDREKTTKKLEEEVRWEGTRHITLLCY